MVENTSKVFQQEGMEEYQSLDLFAVFALIAGLLSVGVIVSNVFLFVAFVGIVCGLISFLRILTSGGILTGTRCSPWHRIRIDVRSVPVFVSIFPKTNHSRGQPRTLNSLVEFASRGRLNEAHQLGMKFEQRQIPGTDLNKYYRDTALVQRWKRHHGQQR